MGSDSKCYSEEVPLTGTIIGHHQKLKDLIWFLKINIFFENYTLNMFFNNNVNFFAQLTMHWSILTKFL